MTEQALDLDNASDDDLKAMGLPARFTLEELQGALTKEEIEALAEDDDPIITLPGEDDPEEDDDPDGDGDGAAGDDSQPGAAADPAPEVDDTPDPVFKPVDVAEHQKVIDTLKDERAALRAKYNDGDLTDDEFDTANEALNDKVVEARSAIKEADRAREGFQNDYAEAWYGRVKTLTERAPELITQEAVAELNGNSVLGLFDFACKHVNAQPEFAHMSQAQRLAQAERITRDVYKEKTGKDLGPTGKAAPAPKPAKDAASPAELVKKQGKRPDPVQTLATVTAATDTEVDDGRFAAVDNATGIDRERLFSRLSPAEQEAYLRG